MSDESITTAQKNAARKAAQKAAKADRDKRYRDKITKVNAICELAGMTERNGDLNADQRERALTVETKAPGLNKTARADFIRTGRTLKDQVEQSHTAAAEEKKAQGARRSAATKANPSGVAARAPKDPEAYKLLEKVTALLTDEDTGERIFKSAFLPNEARLFLEEFKVEKKDDAVIVASRTHADVSHEFSRADLETFAIARQSNSYLRKELAEAKKKDQAPRVKSLEASLATNAEVRAKLVELGDGTKLWGGKLAIFLLAA